MADIKVPKKPKRPLSALDGISIMAIDTDPSSNLYSSLENFRIQNIQVLSVIPIQFHVNGRFGYLVVTYDPSEDPRANQKDSDV